MFSSRLLTSACLPLLLLTAWPSPLVAQNAAGPDPDEHWVRIDPIFQTRLRQAHETAVRGAHARRFGAQSLTPDTFWVGHRAGQTGNYWEVGVGPRRLGANNDGAWTFDAAIHGDSLQGWWPIRTHHTNNSGAILPDVKRPWWAIEIGNQANYVINERRDLSDPAAPGNRTFGVVGVWHSDPGNTGAGAGKGVGWTPLAGSRSAWMGLRRPGDLTVSDPVTGNAFNSGALMFNDRNGTNAVYGSKGTQKKFPGYGSQMDQLLYRDIDVSATSASQGVTFTFKYATAMSTGKSATTSTRTGWFDGDPLAPPVTNDGNFISAEAGSPANALAPVDSFEVYVGAPEEGTFHASDGSVKSIYDPLRRWFNEILNRNARKWLFSAAGNHAATPVTVSISGAEKVAFTSGGKIRLAFRVHTNRGFDDEDFGSRAYSSAGAGAAQVDAVTADIGAGPVSIGEFEGSDPALDIDNSPAISAASAWKSTGKPPSITFHQHDLSSLSFLDICGGLTDPDRVCDMAGGVLAMGDHDRSEKMGGATGTPDENGFWIASSPTVNLVTPGPGANGWDITPAMLPSGVDLLLAYDIYTGGLDAFTDGLLWEFEAQSYPAPQADGVPTWGELRRPGADFFNPTVQCFPDVESLYSFALVQTSNASGIPDSIRIMLSYQKFCYRFGLTNCGQRPNYFDNASLGLVPAPVGSPFYFYSLENWFQDTFPATEDSTLVGTVAFDTTSALVRTGFNIAPTTDNNLRLDVPGDSLYFYANGSDVRVDLLFRVRPGPGNYVVAGDAASGLRRVPTSATAASAGDGSFWGTYMSNPGEKATPGAVVLHAAAAGGWSALVWNSARCDTGEANVFPVTGRGLNSIVNPGSWQTTYHESDPRYATLGIPRNRCFMIDTLGSPYDPNFRCDGTAPVWITTVPHSHTGWDGTTTTIEGTQMLPDGLFTPGTHVEYFLRSEVLSGPGAGIVNMAPDTETVFPQPIEPSLDAHRWAEFSVLPDRWKDPSYGGLGAECALVIDLDDAAGEEAAWDASADSIGFTLPAARGVHDGWSAPPGADINDPAYFVNKNAQAGTSWDLFNICRHGVSFYSTPGASGTIGARYAPRASSPPNLAGYSRQGPTSPMLRQYYSTVILLAGSLGQAILGPQYNSGADDGRMLREFLKASTSLKPKALWASGDHLVEDANAAGGSAQNLVNQYLGAALTNADYRTASGNNAARVNLDATSAIEGALAPYPYSVYDGCLEQGQNVIGPYSGSSTGGGAYDDPVTSSSLGAMVVHPLVALEPWVGVTMGFALGDVTTRTTQSSHGRHVLVSRVNQNLLAPACDLASQCPDCITLGTEPPPVLIDYVRVFNNPAIAGAPAFHFGLARAGRASILLYDVSGRLVRRLADGVYAAGDHVMPWDGRDAQGRAAPAGVYFARVRLGASGFGATRTLVIIK
ncbi:MAG: hypothetical protein HYR73_02200 [Candidatus Eisenbacteria bacterium]|nr:hypothetical protein [Candidatus Eisenbacteria bacterium]